MSTDPLVMLSDAGKEWAEEHKAVSIVANVALLGEEDWPTVHINAARNVANEMGLTKHKIEYGAPTVYLVINGEACTIADNGNVISTNSWIDGVPMWGEGIVADQRGVGGSEGYDHLVRPLDAAEAYAVACGLTIQRIGE